jgi:hypothetical protein
MGTHCYLTGFRILARADKVRPSRATVGEMLGERWEKIGAAEGGGDHHSGLSAVYLRGRSEGGGRWWWKEGIAGERRELRAPKR